MDRWPSHWPLYRSAVYLRGKGLTFGAPILPPQETAKGAYSVVVDIGQNGRTAAMDSEFDIFAQESLDHIFVGPRLENIENLEKFLRSLVKKLKVGKHLIVNTCIRYEEGPGIYPLNPLKIQEVLSKVGRWQLKAEYEHERVSLLILKKLKGSSGILPIKSCPSQKRVAICRFGALGDAIILSAALRALKEEGFHITFLGTPYSWPALENNPYIDNIILQERDAIPNNELGPYWRMWAQDYERFINLSESLEGDLLLVEGREEFYTTQAWRHQRCNKNYYDYTLQRCGLSEIKGRLGELYFTEVEERRAREFFQSLTNKFIVMWALNGSSHHKVYPMMESVLRKFLAEHPQAIALTVGDDLARLLEFEHPQVIEKAGKWSVRESLIATKYVSCVIGPETMVTNAAGCFDTPKITLLSHSSHENLCKYWKNDYCLEPDKTLAPCYPCHCLHYSRESCPIGTVEDTETGKELGRAPICPIAILPVRVLARLEEVYQKHYKA